MSTTTAIATAWLLGAFALFPRIYHVTRDRPPSRSRSYDALVALYKSPAWPWLIAGRLIP